MSDNESPERGSGSDEYETFLRTLATELACLRRESEARLGRCLARINHELRGIEKGRRTGDSEAAR